MRYLALQSASECGRGGEIRTPMSREAPGSSDRRVCLSATPRMRFPWPFTVDGSPFTVFAGVASRIRTRTVPSLSRLPLPLGYRDRPCHSLPLLTGKSGRSLWRRAEESNLVPESTRCLACRPEPASGSPSASKLVAPEGFEPSRPCGPELLRLVRLPGSATGRSQRRRARHRSISEGGAARNSRTPTPGRSRRRFQNLFSPAGAHWRSRTSASTVSGWRSPVEPSGQPFLLVAAEGVEPSSPACDAGALPLGEAAKQLVTSRGIEPRLQAYETRQTSRPCRSLRHVLRVFFGGAVRNRTS